MLPLTISYNYEIVYHRQKERKSLKSPFPCCFDRFFSFLHFLMAYFSTKSEFYPTFYIYLFDLSNSLLTDFYDILLLD